ncbi:prepilin-type N-terminal cleavage/methylation domain-containing protein [Duganella sp. BuS-21]|uniref:type IV pilus modification PilV family protein n=1 Tax=Duganella sp. BuS-21 TaxID=2943848 RepID=UPI0035A62A43
MFTKRQAGLTLIELVIFMVIMGVAAAGILGVLNMGASASADPVRRKQALMIAEALMEEVLLARFSCAQPDLNVDIVAGPGTCANQLTIGIPVGLSRPYGNVANYGSLDGVANRTFAVGGVDVDISGVPLGRDAGLNTVGNATLGGITSTVTLRYMPAVADGLGPAGASLIRSSATQVRALRITIRTTYGSVNEFVELDAYRTRYAPTVTP